MKTLAIVVVLCALCALGAQAGNIPGDVNGDGLVNASDSLLINQVLSGLRDPASISNFTNGDVNGDGTVTGSDSLVINQVVAGLRGCIVTHIEPSSRVEGPCIVTIWPTNAEFGAEGGSGSFSVTISPPSNTVIEITGIGLPTAEQPGWTARINAPVDVELTNIVFVSAEKMLAEIPSFAGAGTALVVITRSADDHSLSFATFANQP